MLRPALAFTALALAAAPASAATYSARPLAAAEGRFITRDIVWQCGPAACLGATDNGRPVTLCQSLAKRVGRVDSFITNGRALGAAELDRCNASAKAARAPALAAQ
jgi:hypothetical protein